MGKRRRKKTLPKSEWRCIWCLACDGPFRRREHVIPESLGGVEVLPRGAVCDNCNSKGLLNGIDEQLNLHPVILAAKLFLGAHRSKRHPKELKHGFEFRRDSSELHVDGALLQPGDSVSMKGVPGGPAVVKASLTGPTQEIGNEHLTRGLHKIAYNALAYELGPSVARARYGHLRELVIKFDEIRTRPVLLKPDFTEQEIRNSSQLPVRFACGYGNERSPEIVSINLRAVRAVVSVAPTTEPLRDWLEGEPGLKVACGEL